MLDNNEVCEICTSKNNGMRYHMEREIYKNNIVRCKKCGDIIKVEFKNREDWSQRHLLMCKCGSIGVDASPYMWRILWPGGNKENWFEDFSEKADEEFLLRPVK